MTYFLQYSEWIEQYHIGNFESFKGHDTRMAFVGIHHMNILEL